MRKTAHILFLVIGIHFFPQVNFAQEQLVQNDTIQDNLGNVADEFQEYFFEALKQKAIENYEKAIIALEKCITLRPEKAILYMELGKNYKHLKNYPLAEKNFEIALQKQLQEPQHIYSELFEVYFTSNQYEKAIPMVKELVKLDDAYYEDLANLYMMVKKPEAALTTLQKVDSLRGPTDYTEDLRRKIFEATGDSGGQVAYLKKQIANHPENTENYIHLINVYGENGNMEEAFSWAKKLELNQPGSEKVQLALYQLYLKKGEYDKAIASMKKVLAGKELEEATKMKVLKDFVAFTKQHPEYENALVEVLDIAMKSGENMASDKELGDFYLKKDKAKALEHYSQALKNNFNDVQMIENTLSLQLELGHYENALELSKKALVIFPSRPKLYLSQGIAYNQMKKFEQAMESFDFGLTYLIDNPGMEAGFYKEMALAYRGLGQEKKAVFYDKKAKETNDKPE